MWLGNISLAPDLSERMRRLCREVLDRIPPGFDENRTISIEESDEIPTPPGGGTGYASAGREEEGESFPFEMPPGVEPEQIWVVRLYRRNLDTLSDAAVRWVIVHELAHVASGLRTGSIVVGGVPVTQTAPGQYEPAPSKETLEDTADRIALQWGFSDERQCFLSETHHG